MTFGIVLLIAGIVLFIIGAVSYDTDNEIGTFFGSIGLLVFIISIIIIVAVANSDDEPNESITTEERTPIPTANDKDKVTSLDRETSYIKLEASFNHTYPEIFLLYCPVCSKSIFLTPTNNYVLCTNCDTKLNPILERTY